MIIHMFSIISATCDEIKGMEMFSGCDAARGMTTCEAHEAKQQWKPAGIVGEYIIYSDYIILYMIF